MLVRCDSAGASHDFLNAVRAREKAKFWVGFELREEVREAILKVPEEAWEAAIRQDGEDREGAEVCELDLCGWPTGTRAICRRERPHPGAQLSFTDHQGWRFQVFITDQEEEDIALLEARHRARARCEDQIRCAKETGLRAFPFQGFVQNPIWLELVLAAHDLLCHFRRVALTGEAQRWEPGALRTGCCTPPGAWSRGVAGLSSGSSATGPGPNFWPPPSLAFASSPRPDRGPTPNPHWS